MSRKPSPPAAVSGDTDEERARRRLALVRVLIWARREAAAMDLDETSDLLHEAIVALDLPKD